MKAFLLRLFLFCFVFFIIDKVFILVLFKIPEYQADRRLEYILEGKINKDLIVIGSSRGADEFIAGQIEQETGLSSYNIGYPGSNIIFHKFLLETLLKYNKAPKILVVAIDNPYEFQKESSLGFRTDILQPLGGYNYINKELVHQKTNNYLSYILMLARLNRDNFKFWKKLDSEENPLLECGSMPLLERKEPLDLKFDTKIINLDLKTEKQDRLDAFHAIEKMCIANNIKIIYCFPPNFKAYNPQLQKRIKKLSTADSRIFVYDTTKIIYKQKEYYYDESHLNIKGAKIFTSELSNYINLNK